MRASGPKAAVEGQVEIPISVDRYNPEKGLLELTRV
jgi:hypothetical protein